MSRTTSRTSALTKLKVIPSGPALTVETGFREGEGPTNLPVPGTTSGFAASGADASAPCGASGSADGASGVGAPFVCAIPGAGAEPAAPLSPWIGCAQEARSRLVATKLSQPLRENARGDGEPVCAVFRSRG